MDYSNEETLVQGIRNRDNAAFEYLRSKCFNQILYTVTTSGGSKEDAEDLFQDGIIVIMGILDKPVKLTCKVTTLFNTVCFKHNNDFLKKNESRQRYLNEYAGDNSYEEHFDEEMDGTVLKTVFWNSFRKLKEKCRDLINKVLEDFDTTKIAQYLGLSTEAARKRKLRCQKNLIGIIQVNPSYISLRKSYELPEIINLVKTL